MISRVSHNRSVEHARRKTSQGVLSKEAHSAHDHGQRIDGPIDTSAMFSVRGLSVKRSARDILQNVDFDLFAKEVVTLIGPNGAGKTTLVKVLLGLERSSGGEVFRRSDVRIGYVPQRIDIDLALPMTVDRFLQLGNGSTRDEVDELLETVAASNVRHQQLARLSGGELQRVVLARALLRRPNVLVLDEPVQGVDHAGEAELYDLIARMRDERDIAVLFVSHDLHVVMASSDRVICLNHHVCCSGRPIAVAQHSEYERLFGPDAARAFAIYQHNHDHTHDLAGRQV